jgi:hypothetical protein
MLADIVSASAGELAQHGASALSVRGRVVDALSAFGTAEKDVTAHFSAQEHRLDTMATMARRRASQARREARQMTRSAYFVHAQIRELGLKLRMLLQQVASVVLKLIVGACLLALAVNILRLIARWAGIQ